MVLEDGCKLGLCFLGPMFFRSQDRVFQRGMTGASRFERDQFDGVGNDSLCVFGISFQVFNDHFDGYMRLIAFPGIVIRDHCHRRISNLGFPCAFGFAEIGHAYDIESSFMVCQRLGSSAECGALHVHIGASPMNAGSLVPGCLVEDGPQFRAGGFRECDVSHDAISEKGMGTRLFCAVQELAWEHDVARFVACLKGTHGAHADDPVDAQRFHRVDVGAVVEFTGQNAMTTSVSWQEYDRSASEFACQELIRRRSERRAHGFPSAFCEPLDVIQSASSDDSDTRMVHNKDTVEFNAFFKVP